MIIDYKNSHRFIFLHSINWLNNLLSSDILCFICQINFYFRTFDDSTPNLLFVTSVWITCWPLLFISLCRLFRDKTLVIPLLSSLGYHWPPEHTSIDAAKQQSNCSQTDICCRGDGCQRADACSRVWKFYQTCTAHLKRRMGLNENDLAPFLPVFVPYTVKTWMIFTAEVVSASVFARCGCHGEVSEMFGSGGCFCGLRVKWE